MSHVCSQFWESLFTILAECSQFCLRPVSLHFKRKSITLPLGGGLRGTKIGNKRFVNKLAFPTLSRDQLRPEGQNRRGETQLRGPEVLGPLRGLGIRPLVSVIRGLGDPFPEAP